jgi:hypothetical protein
VDDSDFELWNKTTNRKIKKTIKSIRNRIYRKSGRLINHLVWELSFTGQTVRMSDKESQISDDLLNGIWNGFSRNITCRKMDKESVQ